MAETTTNGALPDYRPDVRHTRLGPAFYDPVAAADFPQAVLRFRNNDAAREIGLDLLTDTDWIRHFGRFAPLPRNLETPHRCIEGRWHDERFDFVCEQSHRRQGQTSGSPG